MQIMYDPIYAFDIYNIDSRAFEDISPGISMWTAGEIKDIPEDLKVRLRVRGHVYYQKLVDTLLQDAAFKIVDGGKVVNPNYVCARCDAKLVDVFAIHPRTKEGIPREIDGDTLCKACWDNAPKNLTPTGYEFIQSKGN
jgi:hypothetical protein